MHINLTTNAQANPRHQKTNYFGVQRAPPHFCPSGSMTSGSDSDGFFHLKMALYFGRVSPPHPHPPKKKGAPEFEDTPPHEKTFRCFNLVPVLPKGKLGISTKPRNEKTGQDRKGYNWRRKKNNTKSCFMAWGPSKHVFHKILLLLYGYVIPTRFHHLKSSK